MSDAVKSPKHYTEGRKFEPKDVIRDWELNFNVGSAVKYLSRAGRKDDVVQDLKKAQEFIQFEIDAIEAERAKKEPPKDHPNCRCTPPYGKGSHISFEEAIKHSEQIALEKELELMRERFCKDELFSCKPIVLKIPKDRDAKDLIKALRSYGAIIQPAPEKEPTEFDKKAHALYNAYLYRLSELSKELDRVNSSNPLVGAGCNFVQDITLRAGFDPTEVLDDMVKHLMEGK